MYKISILITDVSKGKQIYITCQLNLPFYLKIKMFKNV